MNSLYAIDSGIIKSPNSKIINPTNLTVNRTINIPIAPYRKIIIKNININ
jgi:hypothetical protein